MLIRHDTTPSPTPSSVTKRRRRRENRRKKSRTLIHQIPRQSCARAMPTKMLDKEDDLNRTTRFRDSGKVKRTTSDSNQQLPHPSPHISKTTTSKSLDPNLISSLFFFQTLSALLVLTEVEFPKLLSRRSQLPFHSPQTHHLALRSANTSALHVPRSPILITVSHVLPSPASPSVRWACSTFRVNRMILPLGVWIANFAGLKLLEAGFEDPELLLGCE